RIGKTAEAKKEMEELGQIRGSLVEAKEGYWADQVEIQRRAAEAWVLRAEGKDEEALERMRAAAEMEASTEKHPVTPGAVLPARELLGDLLLEINRPAEALKEYEAALAVSPNRFNAIYGAAKGARLSGNSNKARDYYSQLVSLADSIEGKRPELQEAKTFLKKPAPAGF
ncbi:MAG TPA: hypothetical protein VI382_09665, partial [Candidatus Manganitrophaceae bacterium]|nr:hypothetical protein [Candidatus Manganitrophaceae bacterium]